MATSTQQGASGPPPKPWERAGSSSGPAPFKPPSTGSTSDVVESSGTAKPGEIVSTSPRIAGVNTNAVGRPLPTRPWENNIGTSSYGGAAGYNSSLNYNSGVGSGMYNSLGGGYGGMSGGMYGNSMYRGGYGGTGGLYGSGMYGGGGMYNSGFGGTMGGGYGMGMGMGTGMGMGMGGPYGPQDPNNPPPTPPGFWISFLRVMEGVVSFFGRISFLVDQNTQAIHFFMQALLQLFDRGGTLYGELARFVLRILGRRKSRKILPPGPNGLPLPGPEMQQMDQRFLEGPKPGPGGNWDNVWGNDTHR